MQNKTKAIGILGGTFDPIHFGHLRLGLEIQEDLKLTEVRLLPCFQPVHRDAPIASPETRLAMIKIAVSDTPTLTVDDREITRKGPSYMIDTLESLRTELPNTPLCLILGLDTFLHFDQWHQYEKILDIAHLIIIHRTQYILPGSGIIIDLLKKHQKTDLSTIHTTLAGVILLRPAIPLEISATKIRRLIQNGRDAHYLLPSGVCDYIKEHGVYGPDSL